MVRWRSRTDRNLRNLDHLAESWLAAPVGQAVITENRESCPRSPDEWAVSLIRACGKAVMGRVHSCQDERLMPD
jgi:hypothetical protein